MIYKKSIFVVLILCFIILQISCNSNNGNTKDTLVVDETATFEVESDEVRDINIAITYNEDTKAYTIKSNFQHSDVELVEEGTSLKMIDFEENIAYSLDLNSLTTSNSSWQLTIDAFDTNKPIEYVSVAKGYLMFVEDGDAYIVYHRHNNVDKQIGRVASANIKNQTPCIVSADKTKVAYVVDDGIVIYNVNNQKLIKISDAGKEVVKENFSQRAFFSPQSGYLTFMLENENGIIGFKSLGADSGKLLHDTIFGIAPIWSHNELYISFLYRNSKIPEKKLLIDGVEEVSSDKIAVFNRKTKKINFFTEFSSPNSIISPPIWAKDDSGVIFTTGTDKITNIHFYQLKNKNIISLSEEEGLKNGSFRSLSNVQVARNYIIYTLNKEEGSKILKLVDLTGKGTAIVHEVAPIDFVSGDEVKEEIYKILNGSILYVKGNSVYTIDGFTSRAIVKNKYPLKKLQYLEKSELIASYVLKEEALEIILTKIQ